MNLLVLGCQQLYYNIWLSLVFMLMTTSKSVEASSPTDAPSTLSPTIIATSLFPQVNLNDSTVFLAIGFSIGILFLVVGLGVVVMRRRRLIKPDCLGDGDSRGSMNSFDSTSCIEKGVHKKSPIERLKHKKKEFKGKMSKLRASPSKLGKKVGLKVVEVCNKKKKKKKHSKLIHSNPSSPTSPPLELASMPPPPTSQLQLASMPPPSGSSKQELLLASMPPPSTRKLPKKPSTNKLLQKKPSTNKLLQKQPSTNKLLQKKPSTNKLLHKKPSTNKLLQKKPSTNKFHTKPSVKSHVTSSTTPSSSPAKPSMMANLASLPPPSLPKDTFTRHGPSL